jgi:hypothetical protein
MSARGGRPPATDGRRNGARTMLRGQYIVSVVPAYRVPAHGNTDAVADMSTTVITSNTGSLTPGGELKAGYVDLNITGIDELRQRGFARASIIALAAEGRAAAIARARGRRRGAAYAS